MTTTSAKVHDFILRTDGVSVTDEAVLDALFEAGCDDALVRKASPSRDGCGCDLVTARPLGGQGRITWA